MKFSVVIPMYNTAPYVEATARSVLAQEFSDFEVIVVNDGSTDGCERVVAGIDDPRIRLINKPNTGVSDTRNVGCREARGEYIAFLDSDDYWYPDHLSEAAKFFETHPEIKWYGAREFAIPFDGTPPIDRGKTSSYGMENYFVGGKRYVHSSSFVIRREVFSECGGYPVGMKYFEDYCFQGLVATRYPDLGVNTHVTAIYFTGRPGAATMACDEVGEVCPLYLRTLKILMDGVVMNRVKVPLWPLSVFKMFMRRIIFNATKSEINGYLKEYSALLGRWRMWRWRVFVMVAYGLANASIWQYLGELTSMSASVRYRKTVEIVKHRGISSAMRWLVIVVHYSLRGVMDNVQDRIESRIWL